MRPTPSLVRDLLLAVEAVSPRHFDQASLETFLAQHTYPADQVMAGIEYLKRDGYLSGIISYDDQGQPYHLVIDGLTFQGLDYLDSLRKGGAPGLYLAGLN